MEWKCSSLQIGTWLELEQLRKRSILQLNTKLPTESCSSDQIHLRLSLPLACGLTKDHVSTREPHEERENRARNATVQGSPCFPLYSIPWAEPVAFPQKSWLWRLGRIKRRRRKISPVPGSRWNLVSCAARHMTVLMYVCMYCPL